MFKDSLLPAVLLALAATGCDDVTSPAPVDELEPALALHTYTPGRIVYTGPSRTGIDIFTMDDNGRRRRQVTWSAEGESDPALSPNGSEIAYEKNGAIWKVGVTGSTPERLYWKSGYGADEPAWSPDGMQLAFTLLQVGTGNRDIFVMDVAVHDTAWAVAATSADEFSPTWTPDGYVAYVETDSKGRSWIRGSGSGGASDLFGWSPEWSPDSTRVVYQRTGAGAHSNSQIYVFDFDVGEQRITSMPEEWDDTHPTWSPDRTEIAFVRRHESLSTPGHRGIFRVSASPPYLVRQLVDGQYNQTPHWGICASMGRHDPCF